MSISMYEGEGIYSSRMIPSFLEELVRLNGHIKVRNLVCHLTRRGLRTRNVYRNILFVLEVYQMGG